MTIAQQDTGSIGYMWTNRTSRQAGETCPVCKAAMRETLRAQEARSVFIWYECSVEGCQGRKLKQYAVA